MAEKTVSEAVESGLDAVEGEVEPREWIKRSEVTLWPRPAWFHNFILSLLSYFSISFCTLLKF